ncbi:cytochrome c biogenesis protein ResB [Anaerobranca gottschalkii]|uniref:Cytochrome c biogenesis protein n=1 Tax=Anaerobranca gottschalkii DSM 13577 TaxID=1120990 RepID=A0A1H9ZN04_9FIRM|nr:cytochrome c biogenesis protein ResB [Anaerobranca gottschalkii]SES83105.1 cytochrome c biogenesis protein [Anaerobranca gottschalkii DSM 13577]
MKEDNILKEIWKALHSMRFGIILLLIIGISSIAGTVIPQKNPLIFYQREYSSFMYTIITTLNLHDVYNSWWFITMMVLLAVNLVLCSIIRLPKIIKRMVNVPSLDKELNRKDFLVKKVISNSEVNIEKLFRKGKFNRVKKIETSKGTYFFAHKNRLGYLGSWLSHVGLLIIILSYMFGQITGFETYIYGVPGISERVEGTPYEIQIDDFRIEFRDDLTVNQYISNITVKDFNSKKAIKAGELSVNNPFRAEKFSVYQNGTGWAVDMKLKRNGEEIANRILYQGEIHVDDNQRIALQFVNFYPHFDNSSGRPRTISPFPDNPKLLYTIFYEGRRVDMNVIGMGEELNWEEYTFIIDNPRHFTLLQITSDPGIPGAKLGSLLLLHGLMFAFYFFPKQLKALKMKDGKVIIWGDTDKNKENFKEEIERLLNIY